MTSWLTEIPRSGHTTRTAIQMAASPSLSLGLVLLVLKLYAAATTTSPQHPLSLAPPTPLGSGPLSEWASTIKSQFLTELSQGRADEWTIVMGNEAGGKPSHPSSTPSVPTHIFSSMSRRHRLHGCCDRLGIPSQSSEKRDAESYLPVADCRRCFGSETREPTCVGTC